MSLSIHPLTMAQAREMICWRYDEPYDIYNIAEEDPAFFVDPQNGYWAILDSDEALVGFCNFGADAQVPGGDYGADALDIGMGMRPDLTGQGHGVDHSALVFDFARRNHPNYAEHRVTIAEFNLRAQSVCRSHGFLKVHSFARQPDGKRFLIMVRELSDIAQVHQPR